MYTIFMHKHVKSFSLLILVGLLSGCTSTYLEFDRMTGTAYPQDVTVDGDTISLESIFLSADKWLVVGEDDTAINPLNDDTGTQKQCITNSELDNLMGANRSTQVGPASFECGFWIFKTTCTRYHVYGIVVDHYAAYDSGACKENTVGRIYETTNRSAFSLYYKNTIPPSNDEQYLVVTAQELGHTFNLHHEDSNGTTTIMTGTIDDTYEFNFSDESLDHMPDHPDECVYPGTGSFYSVSSDHSAHSYVTQDCGP